MTEPRPSIPPTSSPSSDQLLLASDHEEITFLRDEASGLRAILAIHDSSRGPALGGIRCREYASETEALDDVRALSLGMTRKTALAGLPAGGGKVVILAHGDMDRAAAFRALGRHIQSRGGQFFTSGDLGTTTEDLAEVAKTTLYVTDPGRDGTGDLAERAAEGVFLAAGTCMDLAGVAEWSRMRIAVQGLGKIGLHLATMAARAGAEVFGCDTDSARAGYAVDHTPLRLVNPDEIYDVKCEVFAPCAQSSLLDATAIERLQCRMVVGAANQPLATEELGDLLHERNILFAPDVITSAGAVIAGSKPAITKHSAVVGLSAISATLREILLESFSSKRPPWRVAHERADAIWRDARRERGAAQRA